LTHRFVVLFDESKVGGMWARGLDKNQEKRFKTQKQHFKLRQLTDGN
jgi:hypothetical protein